MIVEEGKIHSIFISTGRMIRNLKKHQPQLIQLDTTFGTNKQRYKLGVFVYPCRLSNKTRVAAFALLADEREPNITFMVTNFKTIFEQESVPVPSYFFVDKDFTQLHVLQRIFDAATIYLCVFHVLKYMRTVITTLNADVSDLPQFKQEVFSQLKKLVNVRTQDSFQTEVDNWNQLVHGTVKVSKKVTPLKDYFRTNWLDCEELWATYHRRHSPLLFTNTTARVESLFSALKKETANSGLKNPHISTFIPFLLNFFERREWAHDIVSMCSYFVPTKVAKSSTFRLVVISRFLYGWFCIQLSHY